MQLFVIKFDPALAEGGAGQQEKLHCFSKMMQKLT